MNRIVASAVATIAIVFLGMPIHAQSAQKVHRIAYYHWRAGPNALDGTFVRALRGLGWIEGKNIIIDYRWNSRIGGNRAAMVAELVRRNPDVLVIGGRAATAAAMKATSTIPIVMNVVPDALESGLISSLDRPGSNVTASHRNSRAFIRNSSKCFTTRCRTRRVSWFSGEPRSKYPACFTGDRGHGQVTGNHRR